MPYPSFPADIPVAMGTMMRPCANLGCERPVVQYRDPVTGQTVKVHVDDRTPEAECTAPPFTPTDRDVETSTDPAFLRRILTRTRIDLRQAMLALANSACPDDIVTEYRDRTRGFKSRSEMHSYGFYMAGLAGRADNTIEDWKALRKSLNERVYAAIAANPQAPRTILDSLFKLSSRDVRAALARNTAVDLNALLDHTMTRWAPARSGRQSAVAHILAEALRARPLTAQQRVAAVNRVCDGQIEWREMGQVPGDVFFLHHLADWCRDLPGDVIDVSLRRATAALAQHRTSTERIGHTLRRYLDRRMPVPAETLTRLYRGMVIAGDTDTHWEHGWFHQTTALVLGHPNCAPDLLVTACSHDVPLIRQAAAANDACPDEGKVMAALLDRAA